MAGFGKPQQQQKVKQDLSNSRIIEAFDKSLSEYKKGNLENAKTILEKTLQAGQANSTALGLLATIEKASGNNERALRLFKASTDISQNNSDILHNYSILLIEIDPEKAIRMSEKAVNISPNNSKYLERNGYLKWKKGDLESALKATIKAIRLDQTLVDAHINLGGIYKDLGNLDQALASTLKSLELKPNNSRALYSLGRIKMALGTTEEARENLLNAIKNNPQEYGAYYELSTMLKTKEEASDLVKAINSAKTAEATPQNKYLIEFAISNCMHKAENYCEASKHLQLANENKLTIFPSNAEHYQQEIAHNLAQFHSPETSTVNKNCGKGRIFIVGMPRSGSTLLETILSMCPKIKDLGETRSFNKAIARFHMQDGNNSNYQNLNTIYSQIEPIDDTQYKYTTDKNLYNFMRINLIISHMPAAKIIHCRRNPMDNILSMYRSNFATGNNYTADLKDAAKILAAQEQAMQTQKNRYPDKIFTFNYDQFVNKPEHNLRKLLRYLDLEFNESYLHPENSTRSVNTSSVMQARKPISNKSVGGWKNYENMLKPAFKIIQERGIKIE